MITQDAWLIYAGAAVIAVPLAAYLFSVMMDQGVRFAQALLYVMLGAMQLTSSSDRFFFTHTLVLNSSCLFEMIGA